MSLAAQSILSARPCLIVRPRQNVRRPARMIVRAQEEKKEEGGGPDLPDLPEIPTPSAGGKSLFDQVDDFGRKISKETQEASGLDARKLGQQPGDKTGVQFGKEDTPKGEVGRE